MASVSTYLNFDGTCEEAFNFYKGVFGTEFVSGIMRFGDAPAGEGMPPVGDDVKNLVMNVALPITAGYIIMGADVAESMGHTLTRGNNHYLCLDPESREEADRLFAALSEGGEVEMQMTDMFWGDYFGSFKDKYGICWMINCSAKA